MEFSQIYSQDVLVAFLLTLFAGLATGIGSALAFFTRTTNTRFLAIALGFSAGVMVYVSMVEIFINARETLVTEMGVAQGNWIALLSFFGGILFIALIDRMVPSAENPHEVRKIEEVRENLDDNDNGNSEHNFLEKIKKKRLMRMGMFSALAIGLHNFPEGLATFIAALTDVSIGIPIAIAIAIHNIPEGIAISVPIFYATGSRRKAFIYSFLSGLAEPVGAIIGWLILMPYLSDTVFGIIYAGVAGIMVFVSFDELLPAAQEYGEHHLSVYGLVAGMAVMGVSLVLLI
ncbi:MAG: zinc transporter ZupT [Bacteroidales bacterium]